MRVYLATDHAGFELKGKLKGFLRNNGYEVIDCGASSFDKNDDYPVFIGKAAEGLSGDPQSRGIILGGSGQGEAMLANKYKHVRCAIFYGVRESQRAVDAGGNMSSDAWEMLRLARVHNDANMLSLGARFLSEDEAYKAVDIFLKTAFSGEERHRRRIDMVNGLGGR